MATQIQQAERFLALHSGPDPLLLPNPWDLGAAAGLAGCSVEDFTGREDDPIYPAPLAAERIAAAAEIAASGPIRLVLTARAENYLHGRPDLADTIARLQAYQEAGADVLYAPGLTRLPAIRPVMSSLAPPGNGRAPPRRPAVPALAARGAPRASGRSGTGLA